jgi:hypothetical protein
MQTKTTLLNPVAAHAIASAVLVATLAFAPTLAFAAKASAEDRVETRITELRAEIKITPAQEAQWGKVAQVMRDNAKTQDDLTRLRLENEKTMTAVEDLQSYAAIIQAHADGIQTLTPVFAALYDSLSDAQKQEANEAFRHGHRHHHGKHSKH